ncbi:MAG: hypothetical protein ACK4IS_08775 [Erythrobacter sp.]
MRVWVALLASTALVFTSGCGAIRDQLRYPGGAPGRLLDKRTFDASHSKQLALMRMTLALAIAARIGEGSVATQDADVFARQLAEAAREINYAAVDAGFAPADGKNGRVCEIGAGKPRQDPTPTPPSVDYQKQDQECAGYYVNFEANIARIEARIVRAMLTSLPTDKARKFIQELTQGNLMSALWSLTRTMGDVAGAFHRGAGVYRAGLENLAASVPTRSERKMCEAFPAQLKHASTYKQEYDTVRFAAACLGLSETALFDNTMIEPQNLPNRLDPKAFMALFRIARTSCVALPLRSLPTKPQEERTEREARKLACGLLYFEPLQRPDTILMPEEVPVRPEQPAVQSAPNTQPGAEPRLGEVE